MGVDFVALFENKDKEQDVMLRDRDLIVVPAQEQTVKLTGQVVNPGLYIYKPGMTLKHYLDEAGGYNWNVRKSKVRIIKSKTGEWMKRAMIPLSRSAIRFLSRKSRSVIGG